MRAHARSRVARLLARLHEVLGQPFGAGSIMEMGRKAIHEQEQRELLEALESGNRASIAHELADNVIVAYGTAHSLGIALDEVIEEVHAANMRKRWPDGTMQVDWDGKIVKPPGFVPADVEGMLADTDLPSGLALGPDGEPFVWCSECIRWLAFEEIDALTRVDREQLNPGELYALPSTAQFGTDPAVVHGDHRWEVSPALADVLRNWALNRHQAMPHPAAAITGMVEWAESRYVELVNAFMVAPVEDLAVARDQGAAGAWRNAAEDLRGMAGMAPVDMGSTSWRAAHGVHSAAQVAAMRKGTT